MDLLAMILSPVVNWFKRTSLVVQIAVALVLGIAIALLAPGLAAQLSILGTLFIALIKNGILKLGLSPYIQPIVIGGIIILTVVVDVWYKLHAEKKATQAARRKAMESKEVGA